MIPNIVLIGVTGFGATHLTELLRLHEKGLARLVGATVINPEEARDACAQLEAIDCRIFGDYSTMLTAFRGQAQLCCIPTGISWHTPMTLDALASGYHVLVEKPLAGTVAEVEQIIAAAHETGLTVTVGYQDFHHPLAREIKTRVLAGEIGTLRAVRMLTLWPRPASYYARNRWAGRLHDGHGWVYDSPANNAMAHFLNLGMFYAGADLGVSATPTTVEADLMRANPIESFDTIAARFTTAEGVEVGFYGTHATDAHHDATIRLIGDAGVITWVQNLPCTLERDGQVTELGVDSTAVGRQTQFETVAACAAGGDGWRCTPEIARAQTRAIALLHDRVPILTAPADRVRVLQQDNGDTLTVIDGIAEALMAAWERGMLLSA